MHWALQQKRQFNYGTSASVVVAFPIRCFIGSHIEESSRNLSDSSLPLLSSCGGSGYV